MTKREISELIKRYPNIREAIKKGFAQGDVLRRQAEKRDRLDG